MSQTTMQTGLKRRGPKPMTAQEKKAAAEKRKLLKQLAARGIDTPNGPPVAVGDTVVYQGRKFAVVSVSVELTGANGEYIPFADSSAIALA
jgi:hypothetical protein